MTKRLGATFIAVMMASGAGSVLAQTATATLSGSARDVSQAGLPRATITARNLATGAVHTVQTDGAGRYVIPNLQPGDYEVRTELAGFKRSVHPHVRLTVGGASNLDVVLGMGQVAEEVTVTAGEPLIETSRPDVSRVVGVFNLFNRANVRDLNTVWGNVDPNVAPIASFNTPSDVFNPRQAQIGLRVRF